MQAEKIEKIKREVLEESENWRENYEKWFKIIKDWEQQGLITIHQWANFTDYLRNLLREKIDLTIRKTAKAIFEEIEKGIDKMQKMVEKTLKGDDDELSYACGEGEVMGLDLAKGVINELKRKWLGGEE